MGASENMKYKEFKSWKIVKELCEIMPSGLNMGLTFMDSQHLGVSAKELRKIKPSKMPEWIKEEPPLIGMY